MHGLEKSITAQYKIDIKNIVPGREGFIITTSQGKYLLKESNLHPGRIRFVHGAKEHLYNNGFKNLDRYLCTVKGEPYIVFDEKYHTLSRLAEGRVCNFGSRDDVRSAACLLAQLHAASKGYVPPGNSLARDELGKLPGVFHRRLREIKRMERMASRRKSQFDHMYLKYAGYFYDMGKEALDYILSPLYNKLVDETRKEGAFCHHDFTYSNIYFTENGPMVVNFDYCCFDLKVYDIANFIRRRVRKCNWDIDEAKIITDEYRNIEELSPEDFYVMKLILQFPQKFWRVGNRYYNSKRSWAERVFTEKLEEAIDEIDNHKKFLENYEVII